MSNLSTITLTGHKNYIRDVNWSYDNRRIVSASDDKTVKLWDVESGNISRDIEGHQGIVYCAIFVDEIERMVSTGADGRLIFW
mmetsp:Transcript_7624/g.6679  ORF Transcript_7624/g.6679 Transcript_7624/m.6679 type:complete len:83 (-) Transcript_7624:23-271(-)